MNEPSPGQADRDDPHTRSGPYALVLAVYAGLVGLAALLVRRGHLRVPARVPVSDLATMALATHRLSKVLAKDPVTSPLRAPFTEFVGVDGPAELEERARDDSPARHTIGELITCPFCLSQWIASAFVVGHVAAPRATRLVATTFAVSAASEWLHVGLARLRDGTTGDTTSSGSAQ
jgi:hypothetical protein